MSLADLVPKEVLDSSLVTVAQVAEWIGVSIPCVYKWCQGGTLPKLKSLGPRCKRFMAGELRKALREMDKGKDSGKRG